MNIDMRDIKGDLQWNLAIRTSLKFQLSLLYWNYAIWIVYVKLKYSCFGR